MAQQICIQQKHDVCGMWGTVSCGPRLEVPELKMGVQLLPRWRDMHLLRIYNNSGLS